MSQARRLEVAASLFLCGVSLAELHGQAIDVSAKGSSIVAFRNVALIALDREHIETGQTVLVEGDHIVAIGASREVNIDEGATIIDGTDLYLLPGLTDSHVHLEAWAGFRPDFGDGPLYLASGVTTIVNLRGTPTFFDWKRRVQAGQLVGPTIYTAGEFIIGPRGPALARDSGELVVGPNVTTPAEAGQAIRTQLQQGVDVVKFYGGLSGGAYVALLAAAREAGLPLVGHGPDNLGLDALLEGGQSLAHLHSLMNLYFVPIFSNLWVLFGNAVAILVLLGLTATAIIRRWQSDRSASDSSGARRIRILTSSLVGVCVVGLALQIESLLSGRLDPLASFLALAAVALFLMAITGTLFVRIFRTWRDPCSTRLRRAQASAAIAAGVLWTLALATFWLPMSWRATDRGIAEVAQRLSSANISIDTTLVAFAVMTSGADRLARMRDDPAVGYLSPSIRNAWRQTPIPAAPTVSPLAWDFLKRVTRTLHRAGVRLVAGTDALGAPLIVPGKSLHQELELLTSIGLTPYEALRTATVNPAVMLGKDKEFGTITVGKRADLVLVDRNPLEDLRTLKQPVGVMARGRWFSRAELQQMLTALQAP